MLPAKLSLATSSRLHKNRMVSKNDWKDSFALTDGKHQRLGKCICVCMHICVKLCEFTHTPTQAFAKGVVNKIRKFY